MTPRVVDGGPERLGYSSPMSTTLSATLSDVSLPNTRGEEVRLGSLWETDPAIVVFLRHYG